MGQALQDAWQRQDSALAAARAGRCFLCGGAEGRVVWRENGHEARACPCGLTYVWPPAPGPTPEPTATPAEHGPDPTLDPTVDVHGERFYRLSASFKAGWLRGRHAGGRLLEVGCGEGWFLAAVRALGYEVAGIEPQAERARRTAARGIPVQTTFLETAPRPERGYDVVYHCDLLGHFAEPVAALDRMRAMLAPGGLLFFEVGLLGGLGPSWFRRIREVGLPHHRWFYSLAAVRRLLGYAGLELIGMQRFGLVPMLALTCAERALAPSLRSLWQGRRPRGAPGAHGPQNPQAPQAPQAPQIPRDTCELLRAGHAHLENMLRYRVGAVTPPWGPSTLLALARPVGARPPGGER
jgi:SAM-dependent methyltransferase